MDLPINRVWVEFKNTCLEFRSREKLVHTQLEKPFGSYKIISVECLVSSGRQTQGVVEKHCGLLLKVKDTGNKVLWPDTG